MREQKDLQKLFFRGLLILYMAGVMRVIASRLVCDEKKLVLSILIILPL